MAKTLSAGSEVDAWCTKCKMDLNHRIIAMVGTTIKRVVCLTCGGEHNYRAPKSAAKPKKKRATTSRTRTSAAAQRRAEEAARQEAIALWESAIMGRSPEDFTAYAITGVFEPGQLVHHKKFGDGVVAELIEGGKLSIIFEGGPKTLVHGR